MKDDFNDKGVPRPHHYILKLSKTAGVDPRENPEDANKPAFQQALLFIARIRKWAEKAGQAKDLKTEALPVSEDGFPRVRLACPPAFMDDIRNVFAPKIGHVDEIPLPKPAGKKPFWKRIIPF